MVRRSRTPQGVRGLKQESVTLCIPIGCRTPQGVRGLKPLLTSTATTLRASHSARSAWIETEIAKRISISPCVALRKECVD